MSKLTRPPSFSIRETLQKVVITTYAGWDYFDAVLKQIEIAE